MEAFLVILAVVALLILLDVAAVEVGVDSAGVTRDPRAPRRGIQV